MTETEIETEKVLPKFSKFSIVRKATSTVVALSVSYVVTSALKTLVPVDSKADRVRLYVGSYAIAAVVVDKAMDYISDEFDDIKRSISEVNKGLEAKDKTKTDIPSP